MPRSANEMVAALNAFKSHPYTEGDLAELYDITEGFGALSNNSSVIPAMFALMERCPDADLGSPGPMVHAIESLGVPAYQDQLIASVRRCPMYLNVWMVNAILNCEPDPERRALWIGVLRGSLDHPDAKYVSESVRGYLARHARTGAV